MISEALVPTDFPGRLSGGGCLTILSDLQSPYAGED